MSELPSSHDLETAYAAYKRIHGRIRAMAWLRHALLRDIEAQRVLDDASGQVNGDSHWRRLGEVARKEAAEVVALADAMGKAAE
jgi:hypothetical protein